MLRTLFLLLWIIPILGPQAHGAIEIYANGHKYDSLQAYTRWEKSAATKNATKPDSQNKQQEEYILQRSQQWGIKFDPGKVKSFQIGEDGLSDITRHKLFVLSVEQGMISAWKDFYASRAPSQFLKVFDIYPRQLQKVIEQAVTVSGAPKLLISTPGKMRIMSLNPQNAKSSP